MWNRNPKKVLTSVRASFQSTGGSKRVGGVKRIANTLGFSRQYSYKLKYDEQKIAHIKEQVREFVHKVRKLLPQSGIKKIYSLILPDLQAHSIKMGRDKLFEWMRSYNLLITPRRKYVKTTDSNHWLNKYPNLVKGLEVVRPEQVWVSDITYVKTDEGYLYLSMITDAYSRKIVGYHIADNMETTLVSQALKMAIRGRLYDTELIHHSDRGGQYCSKEYVQIATDNSILMSMTENGDPYENALAERMNKTIKEEFFPDRPFKSKELAIKATAQAVTLY
ncbi:IS3 family transposase, partial [Chitinophaga eiseniae]